MTSVARIVWSWCNCLSIDATMIAIAWQAIFTRAFLNRWPSFAESLSLGGAVWLIYVADRLLDSRRLDLSKPHSSRHRFHHDHRFGLTLAWVIGLIGVSTVALTGLNESLLRLGVGVCVSVLVYGAGVHFVDAPRLPKETLVGCIFAVGVSLVAWTEMPSASLAMSTGLAACIFVANCHIVATTESFLDHAQSFRSCAVANDVRWTPGFWFIFLIAVIHGLLGLPWIVSGSLIGSVLIFIWIQQHQADDLVRVSNMVYSPSPRGVWADAVLFFLPVGIAWASMA